MRTCLLIGLALAAACSNAANPTPDAPEVPIDAAAPLDAGPPLAILKINEVAAGEAPDWIEIVNATSAPVQLAEFCFVDVADDFAKCKLFPAMTLPPGAYHVENVSTALTGFGLGSDEEVWLYRIADHRVSDSVDWIEGASLTGSTYARIPDTTGAFQTTNVPTREAVNVATNPNAPLRILVVNEVAPGENPDWFEVVNVTSAPVQLGQFAYVDLAKDFVNMKPFPTMTLAPGAYYAQDVSAAISGFALGADEEIWVYRIADTKLSDGVDWPAGAAPTGMSYARSPDRTGSFAPTASPTRGLPNP